MTIKEFMEFKPCYSEEQIRKIAGEKEEWTALEILRLDSVSAEDKLWAVLRPEFLDDTTFQMFAEWCAQQCKQTDPVCIARIEVEKRYAQGMATEAEVEAASSAAKLSKAWVSGATGKAQVAHLIEMLEEAE